MKKIYLLRHAKAIGGGDMSDHERTLSDDGVLQIQDVAEQFIDDSISIDTVLCSSATRTQQTFELLLQNGVMLPTAQIIDNLYLASASDILNNIHTLDNKYNNVMIIGHNPGIATLCQAFNSKNLNQSDKHSLLTFPPATLAIIEYNGKSWEELTPQLANLVCCRS